MPRDLHSERYRCLRQIIVDQRRKMEVSQAQLARTLGRPQSYVADIERAERRIDVIEFLDIMTALDLDPISVIGKLAEITT